MTDLQTAHHDAEPPQQGPSLPTHYALLGSRLYLHTYIRLLVVVTIVAGTLVAKYLSLIHI